MDLLNSILGAGSGGAAKEIANKLGIDPAQAESVIGALAPALGQGLAKNAQSSGGLDSLLGALQRGNHKQYLDNPALSTDQSGIEEGNKILGHILGSKDVSRQLASRASAETGVSDGLIKQMLPMLATMAMGALSDKSQQAPESGSDLGNVLGAFLGGDKNDSLVGDLLGAAGKLFGR